MSNTKNLTDREAMHDVIPDNCISLYMEEEDTILSNLFNKIENVFDASGTGISICEHAYQRMKERMGWNKSTARRMVKKIYNDSASIASNKHDYYDGAQNMKVVAQSDGTRYISYGDFSFVFRSNVLVTVLNSRKDGFLHYEGATNKVKKVYREHKNAAKHYSFAEEY